MPWNRSDEAHLLVYRLPLVVAGRRPVGIRIDDLQLAVSEGAAGREKAVCQATWTAHAKPVLGGG